MSEKEEKKSSPAERSNRVEKSPVNFTGRLASCWVLVVRVNCNAVTVTDAVQCQGNQLIDERHPIRLAIGNQA
jgi:hypothetical protein